MVDSSTNGSNPVAALDLGSNSYHLIIGRVIGEQLSVIDRLRDPVRMAAGLDDEGRLSEEAMERILESLARFRQRLLDIPSDRVRAIGTNSFRKARDSVELLARASEALGHPIEVLPGAEEARLIYLGVAHDRPRIDGSRLVVDIGGGSTECILGRGFTPIFTDSLHMGCVSYSQRFFTDGAISRKGFKEAEIAAHLELESLERRFRRQGWAECVGSSGTINAIGGILQAAGVTQDEVITLAGIKHLRKLVMANDQADALELPGLQPDRRRVLPGGLAILKAVFESMKIEAMLPSKAALREGLLYDLLGRIRQEDVRDRTIRSLSEHHAVDQEHAARVEETALYCLRQVAGSWGLDTVYDRQLLAWAARMHEVGLALSHPGFHRHGEYILRNSDMPGFSRQDQARLASLVRGHRRKLSRLDLSEFPPQDQRRLLRLIVLLRLAVRLNRARSADPLPVFELEAKKSRVKILLPEAWLEGHPLTHKDLEAEAELLAASKLTLEIASEASPQRVPEPD